MNKSKHKFKPDSTSFSKIAFTKTEKLSGANNGTKNTAKSKEAMTQCSSNKKIQQRFCRFPSTNVACTKEVAAWLRSQRK